MRGKSKKKIFIILIALIVILGIAYKAVLAPTIKSRQIQAKMQEAKKCIEANEFDKSIDLLEEVQNLDIEDEDLLLQIIDVVLTIDGDDAYDFLKRYIDKVGEENVSDKIKNILNSAKKAPTSAKLDTNPGKYVSPIWVKLNKDNMNIGHSYYYTTNGDEPNQNSTKYIGDIYIDKTTTIKIIGYNKDGQSTQVCTFKYVIENSILNKLKNNIETAKKLISETKTGSEIGEISKQEKDKLQSIVNDAEKLIKDKLIRYNDAYNMNEDLKDSIARFKTNIIKPVDKSELKTYIDKAYNLYKNSTEGKEEEQYKQGSRESLKKSIDESESIYNKDSATQNEIDDQVSQLKNAINTFEQQKNKQTASNVEQKILGKYIVISNDPYGMEINRFTKDWIIAGRTESEDWSKRILGRRESGNTIYYTTTEGTVTVKLIDDNTISYNGSVYRLLTAYQLLSIAYNKDPNFACYEVFRGFGVTQSDINYFYSNH